MVRRRVLKKNPLKNFRVMMRLNPYAVVEKKASQHLQEKRRLAKEQAYNKRRGVSSLPSVWQH